MLHATRCVLTVYFMPLFLDIAYFFSTMSTLFVFPLFYRPQGHFPPPEFSFLSLSLSLSLSRVLAPFFTLYFLADHKKVCKNRNQNISEIYF
jgi:hypothetical protein